MKNFKKIILVVLLIIISMTEVSSQELISINAYQDAKLALFDDDHGNKAFTPDIILEIEFQDFQKKRGYISLSLFGEYADLSGGSFGRGGVGISWTFNRLYEDKIELSIMPNFSMISRFGVYQKSLGVDGTLSVKISKKFKLPYKLQGLWRTDLENRYGGSHKNLSGLIGIKYIISTF